MNQRETSPEAITLDTAAAEPEGGAAVEKVEEPKQPSMAWLLLREIVETVVLALIIFLVIRQVVQNYRIESHSMLPNFEEGQFILVNKLAYKFGAPDRGDVIIFHNPNNPDEDYIKRVIGLPGDTVEVRGQEVYINDLLLPEAYPRNPFAPNSHFGPTVVETDRLFVMGDNRGNSTDSRAFGTLSEDLIVGKAWVRVWPVSEVGLIQHYDLEPRPVATGGS